MNPPFDYNFYTDFETYKELVEKDKRNTGYFKRNIKMDLYLVESKYKYLHKINGIEYFKRLNKESQLLCSNVKIYIFVKDNLLFVKYSLSASGKKIKPMLIL